MWGNIFISNSIDDVRSAIASGVTVVALVDDADKYRYINCVIMGNLLPPYEALSAEIDGNIDIANNIYYAYLGSPDKIAAIANILAAMNMGKSILIYVPEEESMHFGFIKVFMAFFDNVFGICIGTAKTECIISQRVEHMARRADVLYINGLIPFDQYCLLLPPGVMPSEIACGMMMRELNYRFNSMQECIGYCSQYISAVRQQLTSDKICPAFREKRP
jgi:hypothetical protein